MSESAWLDAAMVARGIARGRDKAKVLIENGNVTVNGAVVTKPSSKVTDTDEIACNVQERFVGRGGEKLLKVLQETSLCVQGTYCVDIGASTGGFTDCLLQHGASRVFAVDVGHDQLAPSLRADARVVSMEGTDIRDREAVGKHIGDHQIDVCTVDVSFISLTAVWDSITPLLKPQGVVVCLIKPQFEAGRAALSKRGVVKNPKDHLRVLQTLQRFLAEKGYAFSYLSWSPILGGDGNMEYIAVVTASENGADLSLSAIVHTAFETMMK